MKQEAKKDGKPPEETQGKSAKSQYWDRRTRNKPHNRTDWSKLGLLASLTLEGSTSVVGGAL